MSQSKYKHNLHLPIQEAIEKGTDLLDSFPELNAYSEFAAFRGKELNRFVAYIFYAYDPGSGIVAKIKDLHKRKEESILAAGFAAKELNSERVLGVMAMKDEAVNAMITRFFRSFVQNHNFELWASGCEMLAQLMEEVRTPIDKEGMKDDAAQRANKTRMENFVEIPKLIKQIESLENELFGNDKGLKESVNEIAAKTNMGAVEEYLSNKNRDN